MLNEYNKKRDFSKTPEPSGKVKRPAGPLSFVIQKHDARRLHYDFRLEIDGVLVSWAVPKGPSLDPKEKRLAVQTEDHPLDYASFEGVIPKGEYGGGEVIVWDKGVFTPDEDGKLSWDNREEAEKRLKQMLKKGKLSVFLEGEKIRGSWALVKLKNKEKDWLLIKHKDAFVSEKDPTAEDASAVTGRTLDDIRTGRPGKAQPLKAAQEALNRAKSQRFPARIMPMLASLAPKPFSQKGWIYEPKLDGIRAVSYIHGGDATLHSRRGLDLTGQYPTLAKALRAYKDDLVLDGEIVALDETGKPSFQHLQQRLGLTRSADISKAEKNRPIIYYVFDILHANGKDLRPLTLAERKEILRHFLIPSEQVRLVEAFEDDGETAYQACAENGLEGIVGKRIDSVYESGKRSKDWLKVKTTQSSEFIVCGYTQGTGSRNHTFGSLILGEYDGNGELQYVGGVGTGFNDKSLDALLKLMGPLETKKMPFKKKPVGKLNPTWLKPQLVAEVKFFERTRDNILRAPVFMRLREDIKPEEAKPTPVVRIKDIQPADLKKVESVKRTTKKEAPSSVLNEVLEQLDNDKEKLVLQVEGNEIALSNLNKVFWPGGEMGHPVTKRNYIQYLIKVAPYIIPHLTDRPLTLIRFPNGIAGGKFYQKHWDKGLPGFVKTVRFFTEQANVDQDFLVANNVSTLVWLAQIADLELHTVHTRIDPNPDALNLSQDYTGSVEKVENSILNYPDYLVLDLDPYLYSGKEQKGAEPELHKEGFKRGVEVAYWLKDLLDALKIKAYVKTSGRTGLHIYVPILREIDYATVRGICEVFGRQLLKEHPNAITMDWAVVKRTGKVFFDHNMNARGKSLASIYSPRIAPEASVSMPLDWDELDSVYPTDFTVDTVPEILAKRGDRWKDILENKNDLMSLLGGSAAGAGAKGMAANSVNSDERTVSTRKRRSGSQTRRTRKS